MSKITTTTTTTTIPTTTTTSGEEIKSFVNNLEQMTKKELVNHFVKLGLVPAEFHTTHLMYITSLGRSIYVALALRALHYGKTPPALFQWLLKQEEKLNKVLEHSDE